jgi:hypothetical protein
VNDDGSRSLIVVSLILCAVAFVVALLQPKYLGDYFYLGALIFIEVMLVALWGYARRFFPFLILTFLWAGTNVPLRGAWMSGRWIVLGVAAIAGIAIYVKDHRHHFSAVHLTALCCVVSAMISALVSSYPQIAMLKALSLFLLFAYAAAGARVAMLGREGKFFSRILFGCELLAWIGSVSYFLFRYEVFGNPNSLGAVMGVAVLPLLLWGIFVSQEVFLRRRRTFSFLLALLLLFFSYSRAGIAAVIISCAVLCICLCQYRLLVKGGVVALLVAILIAAIAPLRPSESGSIWQFVYKGADANSILASRRSAWDKTAASIRQHPWFGSGFGTTDTGYDAAVDQSVSFVSKAEATSEHGNSYLAITEWVGLLGGLPFFVLVLTVVVTAVRVLMWLRSTGDPFSPAVPIAIVVIAGVIHAGFEDWMFAVGYYLCVFFWSLAFVLFDVLPTRAPSFASSNASFTFAAPPGDLGLTVPGR